MYLLANMKIVTVYDTLTGKIKRELNGHNACVRDVAWHPYKNEIMSSSVSSYLFLNI